MAILNKKIKFNFSKTQLFKHFSLSFRDKAFSNRKLGNFSDKKQQNFLDKKILFNRLREIAYQTIVFIRIIISSKSTILTLTLTKLFVLELQCAAKRTP